MNKSVLEAMYMFISRRLDKEDVVHIYNGILLSLKKNKIVPFAETWMETVIQGEESQKEKNKYCIILLICGI